MKESERDITILNHIEDYNNNEEYSTNLSERIKLKRQTKIICNLDSNWNNYNKLSHLLSLGIDAIELNAEVPFEVRKEIISKVNYFSVENNQHIPIIYNLSYYRVFIKQLKDTNEEEIKVNKGETVQIFSSSKEMQNEKFLYKYQKVKSEEEKNIKVTENKVEVIKMSNLIELSKQIKNFKEEEHKNENQALSILTHPKINPSAFKVSMNIHIKYGEISLEVTSIKDTYVECIAKNSGIISKYSSISVEQENHFKKEMFLTNEIQLVNEIEDSIKLKCNFIIISIINNGKEEINQIRSLLTFNNASHIKIILRLDSPESLYCFDEIYDLVDAVYFSRNCLLLKDSLGKLCFNQKKIVSKCQYNNIPIYINGTFLDSMMTLSYPSRSEIKDLYSIILQGVDGISIFSHILCGKYPFDMINILNEVCTLCEKRVDYSNLFLDILYKAKKPMPTYEATASSSIKTSFNIQSNVVLCLTDIGLLGKLCAKYRPYTPVLCITTDKNVALELSLYRGLFCLVYDTFKNKEIIISYATDYLISSGIISTNSEFVLLSCLDTNEMRVVNAFKIVNQ